MRHIRRSTTAFTVALVLGLSACADFDVANPNDADEARALRNAGDVETLIAGSFSSWWLTSHNLDGVVPILANASYQLSSWPANFGMVAYSEIPRAAVLNNSLDGFYGNMVGYAWTRNYRALSAVARGFRALDEDPELLAEFDALGAGRLQRARAFGRFMQGMAHGSLALLYAEAFVLDETVDVQDEAGRPLALPPVSYQQMMQAALGYFDEAIALADASQPDFTIPALWMSVEVTRDELRQLARNMKARYRANVARTPVERADVSAGGIVDWQAVIDDVGAGLPEWIMDVGFFLAPFWNEMVGQFSSRVGWQQTSYMIEGMADTSGNYQRWLGDPPRQRFPDFTDGSPVLIHTPDLRFPRGATKTDQVANPGTMRQAWAGSRGQPARGTHRWSHYRNSTLDFHRAGGRAVPEVTTHEMRLLQAEGLYRLGDLAGAAALVNVTRVAAGLNATDALGTNTSCVPKLPNSTCGDLLEMLKWEKRMHTAFFGVHANTWFFDGRGWGDLFEGTPLHIPLPCLDAELIGLQCTTTGGPGGPGASPGSIYGIEQTW